ncbi:thioesterase [Umbelopsis sp. PMI_123]|nr:thioesterase [Umbelopsis sp. PMI_123]
MSAATATRRLAQISDHTAIRPLTTKASVSLEPRSRSFYRHFLPIQTRWSDNDQYGHVNNSIFYHYIDTVVNNYLINECDLQPLSSVSPIGLVVTSWANFYKPVSFPAVIEAGLAVTKIGKSSVTYKVGIFERGNEQASVVGGFTHVFVEPKHRKPVSQLPSAMKEGMASILIEEAHP